MKNIIVFTDLDGTLLDSGTYSFQEALPSLKLLKEKNIPVVICSSKTRKEIELYRKKLDNNHPFISENGGAIFIPKGYFNLNLRDTIFIADEEKNYYIITLGIPYSELRKAIGFLKEKGFDLMGFGDMTAEEVAGVTGLNIEEAGIAKERDFDEPFIFRGDEKDTESLIASIQSMGLNFTQGRFFHILGNNDKGKAVSILIDLYRKEFGEVKTVAIGDSLNDFPMLEKVKYPVIVKKPGGQYDRRINVPDLIKADGIGPEGWNSAILKILSGLRLSVQDNHG